MIHRKAQQQTQSPPENYLRTPSPEPGSRTPTVISDCDADDEDTMSMEDVRYTPPFSLAVEDDKLKSHGPYHPQRPTLPDVLSNAAPPPWTLAAFTAYLSQNHCLENLEFTLDAERYKEKYDKLASQAAGKPLLSAGDESGHLKMLWQRLIDAYITPDCPREINIPADVRDTLLSLPNHTTPPSPEVLTNAVKIIYNLMEESVLISFLNEVPPSSRAINIKREKPGSMVEVARRKRGGSDSSHEKKTLSRSKSRRRGSPSSRDSPFASSDPTGRLTANPSSYSSKSNGHRATSHTSSGGSVEPESMTDDSASGHHSPGHEPMTPPNTPPSSEFGGSSPKSRPDNGWKKMLGWKKRSNTPIRDGRFDD